MYARYATPRNITVERLLEILHLVVRDPTHILSREPPAPQPPAPSSLLASAHSLPQPAEVFKTLQFTASKFAEVSSSTKPTPADTSVAGARVPLTVAPNAPGTKLPPTSASTASGAQAQLSAAATKSGTARPQTPIHSRAQAPEPSASSLLAAQNPSAEASSASVSASMPSDANLQEPSADDEPFAQDTQTGFDSSAYSEVLDRGLADIRTPVVPHSERPAQPESPRKKLLAESATKQKHQHSKSKRARHNSPTKSKASAASLPKSPRSKHPGSSAATSSGC